MARMKPVVVNNPRPVNAIPYAARAGLSGKMMRDEMIVSPIVKAAQTVDSRPSAIPASSKVAGPVLDATAVSVVGLRSGCVKWFVNQRVTSASTIPIVVAQKNRKSGWPVIGSSTYQ